MNSILFTGHSTFGVRSAAALVTAAHDADMLRERSVQTKANKWLRRALAEPGIDDFVERMAVADLPPDAAAELAWARMLDEVHGPIHPTHLIDALFVTGGPDAGDAERAVRLALIYVEVGLATAYGAAAHAALERAIAQNLERQVGARLATFLAGRLSLVAMGEASGAVTSLLSQLAATGSVDPQRLLADAVLQGAMFELGYEANAVVRLLRQIHGGLPEVAPADGAAGASGRPGTAVNEYAPPPSVEEPAPPPPPPPPAPEPVRTQTPPAATATAPSPPPPKPPVRPGTEAAPPPGAEAPRRGGGEAAGKRSGGVLAERPFKVSPARRTHILDGDGPNSGGHRWGQGRPKKTEFPHWAPDDQIVENAERIANDPASYKAGVLPTGPDRVVAEGHMVGPNGEVVIIKVVVEPAGEGTITAHPTSLPRNPPGGW